MYWLEVGYDNYEQINKDVSSEPALPADAPSDGSRRSDPGRRARRDRR